MKSTNIISAYESILAIKNSGVSINKINKMLKLKVIEATVLSKFCEELLQNKQLPFDIFDGYFLGYSIKQISKEFDLLRFSDDIVINIELKSELDKFEGIKKIEKQMEQNNYYLTSLNKNILIYTYIENLGLYKYNIKISQVANLCRLNAHDVIGQEFDKVVFVMDKNFRYSDNGNLEATSKNFYSISGMLYQIVTRVVNHLKIIVLDNPELYIKLLEIKALDKHENKI